MNWLPVFLLVQIVVVFTHGGVVNTDQGLIKIDTPSSNNSATDPQRLDVECHITTDNVVAKAKATLSHITTNLCTQSSFENRIKLLEMNINEQIKLLQTSIYRLTSISLSSQRGGGGLSGGVGVGVGVGGRNNERLYRHRQQRRSFDNQQLQ